ncbi:GntR family transcriptional regulator [Telmatospirillum sp.]|uniref:GntR family transcriptional regulator n=1 Tax=Telmatospirillum sp. TaxID=2079197 RepID=UPI00284DFA6E|nr:GntR family transcriptional regulator [Telmatospirillum sp.]MDR3438263.1 GntR family transcriptional regulator [Telmatospirillum sp.]
MSALEQATAPFDKSALSSDSPLPLYLQLARHLRRLMQEGRLDALGALPSERDLAESFGVSRVTVRKALHQLTGEGLLSQRQGAGTFITPAPHVEQRLSMLTSFTDDMQSRGLTAGSRWLEYSVAVATPEEALALDLSPGTTVSRLYRQRLADEVPVAVELAVIPTSFLPDPSIVTGSLYEKLEELGYPPFRALQLLRAVILPPELAPLLDIKAGSAALYIERRTLLESGRPVEFVRSHYRGDIYDFLVELSLAGWSR